MASRIMHSAIAKKILELNNVNDADRFILGSVLPDAYSTLHSMAASHLKIQVCDNTKHTYNLSMFRHLYENKLSVDSLYLGYYLHLIQDLVYRHFVYAEHHWDSKTPGNVKKLHNDYQLLNTYIIEKYSLQDTLVIPENLSDEKICELCSFDTEQLLEEMQADFIPYQEGSIFFLTEKMADTYIMRATKICIKEIEAIESGYSLADEYKWAWSN